MGEILKSRAMTRYGSELEFIGQLSSDGSDVMPVEKPELWQSEKFDMRPLSITEGTYVTSGMHTFIVRLKNPPH